MILVTSEYTPRVTSDFNFQVLCYNGPSTKLTYKLHWCHLHFLSRLTSVLNFLCALIARSHSYEIQRGLFLTSHLGSHMFLIFRFSGRTDHQPFLDFSLGKPYLSSHMILIIQSTVIATDRFKFAIGVIDSVFTCQLDLIRQNDYTDLIPACRSH